MSCSPYTLALELQVAGTVRGTTTWWHWESKTRGAWRKRAEGPLEFQLA